MSATFSNGEYHLIVQIGFKSMSAIEKAGNEALGGEQMKTNNSGKSLQ